MAFNAFFAWRRYPAIFNHPAPALPEDEGSILALHEEVIEALRSLDSFVDITEDDLLRLSEILHSHASSRTPGRAEIVSS